MNYIFLDVDGVLNNSDFLMEHKDDECIIDTASVLQLSYLVKNFNARVVLSSSWRSGLNDDLSAKYKTKKLVDGTEIASRTQQLLTILETFGISLYGKTENIYEGDHWSRPTEILNYIDLNLTENDSYVIFDDDDVAMYSQDGKKGDFKELIKHFVQTDFYGHGLDSQAVYKATKILGNRTSQQLLNKIIFSDLVDDITFERYTDDEKASADVRDKAGNLFNITIKEIEN